MITITESPTQDAGRCQGCYTETKKVHVIGATRIRPEDHSAGFQTTIELRLCIQCMDELKEKINDIIPF